jgi:hypothetical protein
VQAVATGLAGTRAGGCWRWPRLLLQGPHVGPLPLGLVAPQGGPGRLGRGWPPRASHRLAAAPIGCRGLDTAQVRQQGHEGAHHRRGEWMGRSATGMRKRERTSRAGA